MYHIRYMYYLYCLKSVKIFLRTFLGTVEADIPKISKNAQPQTKNSTLLLKK